MVNVNEMPAHGYAKMLERMAPRYHRIAVEIRDYGNEIAVTLYRGSWRYLFRYRWLPKLFSEYEIVKSLLRRREILFRKFT